MPIDALGLIVEGQADELSIPELIKKYFPHATINARPTNGPMKGKLVKYLRILQYDSVPYNKVIIVKDSNGRDPISVRADLENEVGSHTFRFPIGYHVIKRELETWLLADEQALTQVSVRRGGSPISRVNEQLEEIQMPKEYLEGTLRAAGVATYLPEVARQIAAATNIERIRYRCQRYQDFEQVIHDC